MKIPFVQVDAFADRPFTGNPAAVMMLDAWLPDDVLQAIAAENNLSETAFLIPDASGAADYELRWHTPAAEVALCGHATLASGHVILANDPSRHSVTFGTRQAGILSVTRTGAGYGLRLPAWTPLPKSMPDIVAALGFETVVETLWHDKGYALIITEDERAVWTAKPDQVALRALGPLVAIVSAPGREVDIVSRVFTPFYDIPEDPVTGSAHAVMVPYWAVKSGKVHMTAFQASARGGHVECTLDGDAVILGGRCVTVVEGVFTL